MPPAFGVLGGVGFRKGRAGTNLRSLRHCRSLGHSCSLALLCWQEILPVFVRFLYFEKWHLKTSCDVHV